MGLVRREIPFGESKKSGKRALYHIADPFMRMWFRTVAPHRAILAQAPAAVRRDLWAKERPGLCASAWEELCRQSVVLAAHTRARYWQGRGPEWDVVSCSLDGKCGLLGEVKWSERAFRRVELVQVADSLRGKGVPPVLTKVPEIVYCVFVPKVEDGARALDGMLVVDAAAVAAAGT
jgi:hypothetical protein